MEVSAYQVVMALLAMFGFVALWFVKPAKDRADAAFQKIDKLKEELSDYKLHVAEHYVTDTTLEKHFERIESQISELKEMMKSQ